MVDTTEHLALSVDAVREAYVNAMACYQGVEVRVFERDPDAWVALWRYQGRTLTNHVRFDEMALAEVTPATVAEAMRKRAYRNLDGWYRHPEQSAGRA